MEKLIYIFMPMALLYKLFGKKKETIFESIIRYLSLCLIDNLICIFLLRKAWEMLDFGVGLKYVFNYSILGLFVGLILAIIHNFVINKFDIKFEVIKDEETKKK